MDLMDIMLYGDGNVMEKKKEALNTLPDPEVVTQLGQAELDRIKAEARKNNMPADIIAKLDDPSAQKDFLMSYMNILNGYFGKFPDKRQELSTKRQETTAKTNVSVGANVSLLG